MQPIEDKKIRLIDFLAKRDSEWRKMAMYHTKNDRDKADDLIQEFYIKMNDKDNRNKINLQEKYDDYIFLILKNLNHDMFYKNKKWNKTYIDDNYDSIDEFIEFGDSNKKTKAEFINISLKNNFDDLNNLHEKECFEDFYKKIELFIKEDYKNDTKNYKVGLLKLNAFEGMSMRKIAKATGLSLRVVQLSIESVKKLIKNKYGESYEEYKQNIQDGKD